MNLYAWIYVSNFHPMKLKLLDALFVTEILIRSVTEMQTQLDSAYRQYVFIYKRSMKLPRGKVVSGSRDHITGA